MFQGRGRWAVGACVLTAICTGTAAAQDVEPAPLYAAAVPAPQVEKESRAGFLKLILVDALWVPSQTGGNTFGIIGAHLSFAHIGRIYFYGPPGLMLIRQKTDRGWMFRPAYTWGISFHLTDFKVPGTERRAELFVNFTKVWSTGDQRSGADMAGLSFSWRK